MIQKILFTLLLVFLFMGCTERIKTPTLENLKLQRFASCNELEKALKAERSEDVPPYLRGGDFTATAEADAGSSNNVSAPLGETNLQVEGVDELDYAKADGDFIYRLKAADYFVWGGGVGGEISLAYPDSGCEGCGLNPSQIIVLRRSPVGDAILVDTFDLPESLYNGGIYVTASKVIAIGDTGSKTIIHVLERSASNGTLTLSSTREMEGSLQGSRMIGSRIYLILSKWLEPRYDDVENPPVEEELPTTIYSGEEKNIVGCTDILVEPAALNGEVTTDPGTGVVTYPYVINNLICAMTLDIENMEEDPSGECLAGNGWGTVIYASTSNLFIASTAWNTETPIHQFVLASESAPTKYVGTALVHGDLLNQFSMDEYNNHLRVATTTWDFVEPEETNEVRIFKLGDSDPEEVGSLNGLAPSERIYAVRFMGDTGYVVTFEQVDPLFVIDISDPTAPIVRGELLVPGFSTYLHPMQDGYLLSIGKENLNVALSIFDVRNLDEPLLLHRAVLGGDYGSDSEALYDHKAFRFISGEGLVIFPAAIYGAGVTDFGFMLYSASVSGGISLAGQSLYPVESAWSYTAGGRSFFNSGVIALLGGGKLVLRSASAPNADLKRFDAE